MQQSKSEEGPTQKDQPPTMQDNKKSILLTVDIIQVLESIVGQTNTVFVLLVFSSIGAMRVLFLGVLDPLLFMSPDRGDDY